MLYLDHAATTPLAEEVLAVFYDALRDRFGNPSSLHRLGVEAEAALRRARETVARGLQCNPQEVIFTSGGTEANNLAIKGMAWERQSRGKHVVTSQVEHASVLEACRFLERQGFEVTYLPVDSQGLVSLDDVRRSVREDTVLVSLQLVNNETGALQPVAEVGRWLKTLRRPPRFHVDAVQALGKVPLDLNSWGVDAASFSAHKLHGPKGVGFLFLRRGVPVEPLLHGGGQEGGVRSGTENLPAIMAAAEAVRLATRDVVANRQRLAALRQVLVTGLKEAIPDLVVNGPADPQRVAAHIVSVAVPGVRAEVLLHALEERGVYVSTQSACSSRKQVGSHVLAAMNLPQSIREGTLRLSLSPRQTEADMLRAAEAFKAAVAELRPFAMME